MTENAYATMTEQGYEAQDARFETVEQLARKMSISLEEARNALEDAGWNTLTATHLLEQEEFRRKQALNEVAESCAGAAGDTFTEDTDAEDTDAAGKATSSEKTATKPNRWLGNLCEHLRRLVAYGNHNRFVISKGRDQLLEMPMTVLALLLLCSFGTSALLMVAGLFAGCRYSVAARV